MLGIYLHVLAGDGVSQSSSPSGIEESYLPIAYLLYLSIQTYWDHRGRMKRGWNSHGQMVGVSPHVLAEGMGDPNLSRGLESKNPKGHLLHFYTLDQ